MIIKKEHLKEQYQKGDVLLQGNKLLIPIYDDNGEFIEDKTVLIQDLEPYVKDIRMFNKRGGYAKYIQNLEEEKEQEELRIKQEEQRQEWIKESAISKVNDFFNSYKIPKDENEELILKTIYEEKYKNIQVKKISEIFPKIEQRGEVFEHIVKLYLQTLYINPNTSLIPPLILEQKEDGNFLLLDGNHRFNAFYLYYNQTQEDLSINIIIQDELNTQEENTYKNISEVLEELRDLNISQEQAKAQINISYNQKVQSLTQGISQEEKNTWAIQKEEAQSYKRDGTTPVFLTALANSRGVPLDMLIDKVLAKSKSYAMAVGRLTGEKQKEEDKLQSEHN